MYILRLRVHLWHVSVPNQLKSLGGFQPCHQTFLVPVLADTVPQAFVRWHAQRRTKETQNLANPLSGFH